MAKRTEMAAPADTDLALDDEYARQLLGGLMESRTTVVEVGGGKPLLRLISGDWLFGQGDDPVQPGSHWAINVKTLRWGFVCWTDYPKGTKNKRLGLVTVPMTQNRPPRPDPIEGFAFTDYFNVEALCLDGEDEGLEVSYGTNSVGGTRAFLRLRDAIILQLQKDIQYPCPVVTLSSESYKGNYGLTYNPIFTITGWADLGGNLAPAAGSAQAKLAPQAPPAAPAAPAAPARQRKAPLNGDAVQTVQTVPDPVQTVPDPAPVHTGQRRRHRPAF
jgi:hypothetical protein